MNNFIRRIISNTGIGWHHICTQLLNKEIKLKMTGLGENTLSCHIHTYIYQSYQIALLNAWYGYISTFLSENKQLHYSTTLKKESKDESQEKRNMNLFKGCEIVRDKRILVLYVVAPLHLWTSTTHGYRGWWLSWHAAICANNFRFPSRTYLTASCPAI